MTIEICVSLAVQKTSQVSSFVKKAESMGADLIEIRLDHLQSLDGIGRVIADANVPLIATNRQRKQSGEPDKHTQQKSKRISKLLEVARHGFSYVDVELATPKVESVIEELVDTGVKPIVSFHDFDRTPKIEKLMEIVHSEINVGADVCKVVTSAATVSDNIPCLFLASEMSRKTKIVCFAMGKEGVLSRVLSPLFGASFTYASLEEGLETASGQLSIRHLRKIYKCLGV
jgi:3-dehydroquinate dehydratase-1